MNAQNKKWIVVMVLFLSATYVLYAKEKSAKQNSARESKPAASASKESSQKQDRPSSRSESAPRSQTAARTKESSKQAAPVRSTSSDSKPANASGTMSRTVKVSEKAVSRANENSQVVRSNQRSVEVDNSRAKSRTVSSAVKTEPPKTDTVFSSGTRKAETVAAPSKTQTGKEAKRVTGPYAVRSKDTENRKDDTQTKTKDASSVKTGRDVTVVTSKPAPSETAKTERQRPQRSDIKTDRTDAKSVVAAEPDKIAADRTVRVTRDNMADRAQRVTTDQIRDSRRSRDGIDLKTDAASGDKTRQRVITRIDRSEDRDGRRTDAPSIRDGRRSEGDRRNDAVIQAAEFGTGKDRHDRTGRDFRPQTRKDFSGRHISRAEDHDSQIVINGNKNVVVMGDVTKIKSRPYVPRKLYKDYDHVRHSHGWRDYGSYFSLSFSLNSCGQIAYVPYGGYYGFTYYYPRYHRRYVFVSLGGWWPSDYRYRRYYWYGCHPYYWYGPTVVYPYTAPVANEYNTYNTYNYYQTAPTVENAATESGTWKYPFGDQNYDVGDYVDKISPVDEPEFETAADLCFAQAVELFTAGKYEEATAQFREAIRISPDDVVLPFTYSQALFANEEYAHSAAVLRAALAAIPDDQLTIYYPRGLYEKEEYLTAQIAALEKAAQAEPFAGDYHLLLGYQYLGIGDLQKAAAPLARAAQDPANEQAAAMLIELATKIQETPTED